MKQKSFFVLIAIFLSGCATSPSQKTERLQGHWTLGAAFSVFRPLHGSKEYWFVASNLPPEFKHYFDSLPSYPDHNSESERSTSSYMDFDAIIYNDPQLPEHQAVKIKKLYSYGPPHQDYLQSVQTGINDR